MESPRGVLPKNLTKLSTRTTFAGSLCASCVPLLNFTNSLETRMWFHGCLILPVRTRNTWRLDNNRSWPRRGTDSP
jgi:hypothetical protein